MSKLKNLSCFIFYLFLFAVIFSACSYNNNYRNASQPGAASSKTGYYYNSSPYGFLIYRYSGPKESRLLKLRYNSGKKSSADYGKMKDITYNFFDSIRNTENRSPTPYSVPDMVYIHKNLYMDMTKITNLHYQEFLFFIERDSSRSYLVKQLPYYVLSGADSTSENFSIYNYFSNPAYRYFPVIGISQEQGEEYCKWRSRFIKLYTDFPSSDPSAKQNLAVIRLPTEKEWEFVASVFNLGNPSPDYLLSVYLMQLKVNEKQSPLIQDLTKTKSQNEKALIADIKEFNRQKKKIIALDIRHHSPYFLNFKYPFYVYAYPPNEFGIYGLIGGTYELVAEKDFVKGASWNTEWKDIDIKKNIYNPDPLEVGFRCVCEVIPSDRKIRR